MSKDEALSLGELLTTEPNKFRTYREPNGSITIWLPADCSSPDKERIEYHPYPEIYLTSIEREKVQRGEVLNALPLISLKVLTDKCFSHNPKSDLSMKTGMISFDGDKKNDIEEFMRKSHQVFANFDERFPFASPSYYGRWIPTDHHDNSLFTFRESNDKEFTEKFLLVIEELLKIASQSISLEVTYGLLSRFALLREPLRKYVRKVLCSEKNLDEVSLENFSSDQMNLLALYHLVLRTVDQLALRLTEQVEEQESIKYPKLRVQELTVRICKAITNFENCHAEGKTDQIHFGGSWDLKLQMLISCFDSYLQVKSLIRDSAWSVIYTLITQGGTCIPETAEQLTQLTEFYPKHSKRIKEVQLLFRFAKTDHDRIIITQWLLKELFIDPLLRIGKGWKHLEKLNRRDAQ